jgi:hypothetical protein
MDMSARASLFEYPASMLVHWPTGPVATCDIHGEQLIGVGRFLGTHIVATKLMEPAECVNCLNEGPPDA